MDIPKVGDKVSVAKWDASVPPYNQLRDPATVTKIETDEVCETGTMVMVMGASGTMAQLDLNWLLPYKEDKP